MTDSKHIFQLALPEEDFEWALPTDDSNYKVIRSLPQFLHGSVWEPIHMELLKSDVGSRGGLCQVSWTGVLLVRPRLRSEVGGQRRGPRLGFGSRGWSGGGVGCRTPRCTA